jgi:hypothetical protein
MPDSQIKWRTAGKVSSRCSAKDAFTEWGQLPKKAALPRIGTLIRPAAVPPLL